MDVLMLSPTISMALTALATLDGFTFMDSETTLLLKLDHKDAERMLRARQSTPHAINQNYSSLEISFTSRTAEEV